MHLLLAQKGTIDDGGEAVDLGQSPADLVVLTAADTEIAGLAGAANRLGEAAPSLRLANFLRLKHPMSVDAYVDRTARHAKLIVVRLLGGRAYWPYGLDALLSAVQRSGAHLCVLPGDDKPDAGLDEYNTVPGEFRDLLWRYLIEGGAENADRFLQACTAFLNGSQMPGEARPLLKAGRLEIDRRERDPSRPATPTVRLPTAGTSPSLQYNDRAQSPRAAIVFYRALVQSGQTQAVETLARAMTEAGIQTEAIFVSSLKDPVSIETVRSLFAKNPPDVVVNLTGFAVSSPGGTRTPTVLEEHGAVVLQAVLASGNAEAWEQSSQGLSARDLAMSVALPEVDGRILSRAIAFKTAGEWDTLTQTDIIAHKPLIDRVRFVADLAARWARLRQKANGDKRIALVLANYPNRDGRLGNGVGLDTPAGTIEVLHAMQDSGYEVDGIPDDGNALIDHLMAGPTNAGTTAREIRETLSLRKYRSFFDTLPQSVRTRITDRWGEPESDPFVIEHGGEPAFAVPLSKLGETLIGIQPARGYNIDPKETYHSPDLVPPHNYLAFYAYLRQAADVDAIVHMGKHGNLEWLPGKALALSEGCFPEAILGPVPHLYPFIVNDPGEGTQAKRRTSAVIVDHLTPPLTRAETYGDLKDLEALVDEYYEASGSDPRRLALLKPRILDLVRDIGLDQDAGIGADETDDTALEKLDAYLCDLKEMQIRDGLHIFGKAPEGRLLTDLTVALARLPRGSEVEDGSLHRAIAEDLLAGEGDEGSLTTLNSVSLENAERRRAAAPDLPLSPPLEEISPATTVRARDPSSAATSNIPFDPLDCDFAAPWIGPRPQLLQTLSADPWRTNGDTVERIELLAAKLVAGETRPDNMPKTARVLHAIQTRIMPSVEACGSAEIRGLLAGLSGCFVEPGPSGAPTRGRPDVLPTGRNFFSVDTRAVPTEAAFELGRKSAELLLTRHLQDHGEYPEAIGLTAWGTSNMRTGGDDIAQALALIGVTPEWDRGSRRVTGFRILTQAELGRPRVDVTLRISGFFRDAFPDQIALFDRAVRAVAALEEDTEDNPIAARIAKETSELKAAGIADAEAERRAGFRVYGSKPGAYGAGLQALIDEKGWDSAADLAESYLTWGGYAYGPDAEGIAERDGFEKRIAGIDAVVQNQDNREHDLLDSDDYYQFEGGMTAAAEHLSGKRPAIYHNDHSRPERPVIRALDEEIGRVVRARVVNPKWIAGVMRHGYKGAFEMAATVDYMFAFAATTGAVKDHHFDAVYRAFVLDPDVRAFMEDNNPHAFAEMSDRLVEAIDRGLWAPKSNSARSELADILTLDRTNEAAASVRGL